VEPGKAVNFEKILLMPQKLKIQTLIASTFQDLWPVPKTRYLVLKGGETLGDLKIFEWRNGTVRSMLPEGSPFMAARCVRIFTVKGSSFVLIQAKAPSGMKFLGCQLDKDKPEVEDLSVLFEKGEPQEVLWEGSRPDYLFARYGMHLRLLDLAKRRAIRIFSQRSGVSGFLKARFMPFAGP
jgi:hypothetical protein